MENELHLSKLAIGYKKPILKDINISSSLNQMVAVVGRNGEGKSTLLKTLSGLLNVLEGSVTFGRTSIAAISKKQMAKLVSVVLTNKITIRDVTTRDFISFGRYPHTNWMDTRNQEDEQQIDRAIDLCGIRHLKSKNYLELSDGEKQKVNIARAIAQDTPIIILDEPTAYLDLVNKVEILQLLKRLVDDHRKTVIFSSHHIELALQLCDEIWLLNANRIHVASPEELIDSELLNTLFHAEAMVFDKASKSFRLK